MDSVSVSRVGAEEAHGILPSWRESMDRVSVADPFLRGFSLIAKQNQFALLRAYRASFTPRARPGSRQNGAQVVPWGFDDGRECLMRCKSGT